MDVLDWPLVVLENSVHNYIRLSRWEGTLVNLIKHILECRGIWPESNVYIWFFCRRLAMQAMLCRIGHGFSRFVFNLDWCEDFAFMRLACIIRCDFNLHPTKFNSKMKVNKISTLQHVVQDHQTVPFALRVHTLVNQVFDVSLQENTNWEYQLLIFLS